MRKYGGGWIHGARWRWLSRCCPAKKRWLVLKEGYLATIREDNSISWVLLFDKNFHVEVRCVRSNPSSPSQAGAHLPHIFHTPSPPTQTPRQLKRTLFGRNRVLQIRGGTRELRVRSMGVSEAKVWRRLRRAAKMLFFVLCCTLFTSISMFPCSYRNGLPRSKLQPSTARGRARTRRNPLPRRALARMRNGWCRVPFAPPPIHAIPLVLTLQLAPNPLRYVDAQHYFADVADALEAAQEEIFITDWMFVMRVRGWGRECGIARDPYFLLFPVGRLSPELLMKRSGSNVADDYWQLYQILKRRAVRVLSCA